MFESEEAAQRDPELEQLNEISQVEEAAQIDPDPEQLNEIFKAEEAAQIDPEPEQLNVIFEFDAALIDPEQKQLNNCFPESYRKHIYANYLYSQESISRVKKLRHFKINQVLKIDALFTCGW